MLIKIWSYSKSHADTAGFHWLPGATVWATLPTGGDWLHATPALLHPSACTARCPPVLWAQGQCQAVVLLRTTLPTERSRMGCKWFTLDFDVWKMRQIIIFVKKKKNAEGCYPLMVCISRSLLPNYLPVTAMIDFSALWTAYAALLCLDKRLQGLSILILLCTVLTLSKANIFLSWTSII